MHSFVGKIEDIMGLLGADPNIGGDETQEIPSEHHEFENFKLFVIQYVQEHDDVEPNHQFLGQIENSADPDEIESFLRNGLDYCDQCMINMFKKYVGGPEHEQSTPCGCGGEGIQEGKTMKKNKMNFRRRDARIKAKKKAQKGSTYGMGDAPAGNGDDE